jgi:hypothetical protein
MKIILFRFEKEKIHYLESDINSGNITIGEKEKISLESTKSRGEKYQKISEELQRIHTKYSPNLFACQIPQKYKGAIKDEESFANSVILNFFSHQNNIELLELTPPIVRDKLSIPNKDFKEKLEQEKENILNNYSIKKSDKLTDGFVFLSLLKDTF